MLLHLENLKQKFTEIGYSPQLTEIIGKTINKKKKRQNNLSTQSATPYTTWACP